MLATALDILRITAAVIMAALSVAALRIALEVLLSRPTNSQIVAEKRRRAVSSLFRHINRPNPKDTPNGQ